MTIDFSIGDKVVVNNAYVVVTLAPSTSLVLRNAVSTLGMLGSVVGTVAAVGNFATGSAILSFIRVVPTNTGMQAYNDGSGIIIYFETDAQLNNSFELSTAFFPDVNTQRVFNATGGTLLKGRLVYNTGFSVANQLAMVDYASAAAAPTAFFIGVLLEDIASGASGACLTQGAYQGLDTSLGTINQVLFLSDTPGLFSLVAGTVEAIIGRIQVVSTEGTIFIAGEFPLGSGTGGGAQGVTGIQGNTGVCCAETGIQGVTGLQGITGLGDTGIRGLTGFQGVTGIQGETGIRGLTGLVGDTGLQGPTGIQGITGIQGVTGIQGETGFIGTTGLLGPTGIQGITGVVGVTGIIGDTGLIGTTGLLGPTGIQGETGFGMGSTGLIGTTGLLGPTGIQGETGFGLGVTGLQGPTGIQGVTGIQGFTGLQGVTGLTGETGIQGLTGLQGFTGFGTGATGIQGLTGIGVAGSLERLNTTVVNMITGGATEVVIYNQGAGLGLVIVDVVVRLTAASAITVVPTVGVGFNAAGADNVFVPVALTGVTAVNDIWTFASTAKAVYAPGTATLLLGIDTGATGTTMLTSVDVIGYRF